MNIKELSTPCFLVNLDVLEGNIKRYQEAVDKNNTQLWPMLKTHKSTEITRMQIDAGAEGVLTGTLDEAEAVVEKLGVKKIMLAYPVFGRTNLERVRRLNEKAEIYAAVDSSESVRALSSALGEDHIKCLVIYDSGLGRFGVSPEGVVSLVEEIANHSNLSFSGICTHTGQVYGVSSREEVPAITEKEIGLTKNILELLKENDIRTEIVATGTTPTFEEAIKCEEINVSRPGNYVFFDAIQVALGAATIDECSLTVMATIVSNPNEELFILDCGSKCLGLDKGAHGASLVEGYGIIKGHPELVVTGLSEEVAKVKISGQTELKVGDRVEIIPNHSCSAANMTSHLVGHRDGVVERYFQVDIRGNSKKPSAL